MSLIGSRPRSVEDLPPRPVAPPLQTGDCYYCLASLKTPLDVALHGRCDRVLAMKYRRMGDRDGRVRL
jgi:hypothetical protein